MASASGSGFIPICAPSAATRRTSRARMRSLILGSLLPASAAIWDQSSCMALVLPDAFGLGSKRQRAGVDGRHPPANDSSFGVVIDPDALPAAASWPGGDETVPLPVFSCRRRVPVG